jgi:hypothetical protein
MERLDDVGARLSQQAHASRQPLSAVLRAYAANATEVECARLEAVFQDLFGGDDSWIEALLDASGPARTKDGLIDEYLDSVVAFGIHDWSREPFGGAAHCWRPGADSVAAIKRLVAFGLQARPEQANIHVCGEAYSDFQGFIEGALHTAEAVCRSIAGPELQIDLPPLEAGRA